MNKKIVLVSMVLVLLPFCLADKPASSGTVSSMSEIHTDVNNVFFDKEHHFSVTVFDSGGDVIANEPCVYWTEYKYTGNVLETYEMKKDCLIGLVDCYYTTNQDGNLFGTINITDEYYDIRREYTLRVSCDQVISSVDFNVLTWKSEQTMMDWGSYTVDNLYLIGIPLTVLVLLILGIIFLYKVLFTIAKP